VCTHKKKRKSSGNAMGDKLEGNGLQYDIIIKNHYLELLNEDKRQFLDIFLHVLDVSLASDCKNNARRRMGPPKKIMQACPLSLAYFI
jgi:hypothetical protein